MPDVWRRVMRALRRRVLHGSGVSDKYVGGELLADIGIVSASEYHLPVAGGLLDQSAWWFELRQELRSEEANIQNEQHKRRSS